MNLNAFISNKPELNLFIENRLANFAKEEELPCIYYEFISGFKILGQDFNYF